MTLKGAHEEHTDHIFTFNIQYDIIIFKQKNNDIYYLYRSTSQNEQLLPIKQ